MPKRVNKLPPGAVSLSAYAEHRGVSRAAVTKAVQEARLSQCLFEHGGRKWIIDVAAADAEWKANTRSTGRTLDRLDEADVPPIAVSQARLEAARAALAELDLSERRGDLVPTDEVEEKFVEVVTAAKTRLLGLPARIKQRLPHIVAADISVIDSLVREALEALADGQGE